MSITLLESLEGSFCDNSDRVSAITGSRRAFALLKRKIGDILREPFKPIGPSAMITPMPGPEQDSLATASQWVEQLLQGRTATAIAIMAVAILGYQTMLGRFSMKSAVRVVLGCFILFGSSAIARSLMDRVRDAGAPFATRDVYPPPPAIPPMPIVKPTISPPPNSANPFDPYAANAQ